MKNKKQFYALMVIVMFLLLAYGFSTSESDTVMAIIITGFISIHASVAYLKPLSIILFKDKYQDYLMSMFLIRIDTILFLYFFISPAAIIIDIFLIFLGAIVLLPFSRKMETSYRKASVTTPVNSTNNSIELKCAKCGGILQVTDNFCENCGEPFSGNNVTVSLNTDIQQDRKIVYASSFDSMYSLPEDKMLEEFLNRELEKAQINRSEKLIPTEILRKKQILNLIFSILVFVYISLIFFHFPLLTYIIGLIILIVFRKLTNKYDLMSFLIKQIKARPSEKISNIVMNVKTSFVIDSSKKTFIISICLAIALPILIFSKPRIMYEKMDNGYGVRFYTFGLTNFKTATIPETYKGEKIISLRGNTFSNMPFLKNVTLPNSIIEIRGQAFKNDKNLLEVDLPNSLEYLGGGAFYNCTSLKSIEIPDTVTYIGGEAFYNATSLESAKLSSNITEIRGNTFENCSSLTSIAIPNSVTRIGGHAFYGCTSLGAVSISKDSKLTEIGSSAFRQCSSLTTITLPNTTYVNERAFKESPTSIYYHNNYNDEFNYNNDNYWGIYE